MVNIPPREEWLTVKQVSLFLGIRAARVYRLHRVGYKSKSGTPVKLEMFRTISGLSTTRKLIEDFEQRLNG
jgi:hypothetical protein